jgi:RNA polymerase sigma-70 factor (ECF subfamily)
MERALADDLRERRPEAVDDLHAVLGEEIQAIAQVILRDRDEAADVLEETVIAAWEHARRLRDPAGLRPWLLRTATNLALRRRRTNERLVTLVAGEDAAPAPSTPAEMRLVILESLAMLAPRERAVVALTCLADLSIGEAARAMGTRPKAAGALLDDALDKLQYSMVDDAEIVDDAEPHPARVEIRRV